MRTRIKEFFFTFFVAGVFLAQGAGPGARGVTGPGRDIRGDETVNFWSRYGSAVIDADRILFTPGEDIPVRFRITNRGYTVIRVFPFQEAGRTFQFMVTDRRGREIEPDLDRARQAVREDGRRAVVSLQGESVKEIILHPGESFERVVHLNDFYRFEPQKEYRVSGYFFPDARRNFFVRTTNTLQIRIDRNRRDYGTLADQASAEPPAGDGLSPEETVYLFLSAEMQKKWTNYLKYLELNKFITAYDRFASRYAVSSRLEKPRVLEEFRRYLTAAPADQLRRFKIVGEDFEREQNGAVLSGGRATVTVEATRENAGYSVRYRYEYVLERATGPGEGSPWQIVYVTAKVLK